MDTEFEATLDATDEILLDVASVLELSHADRRVAENRYRRLKTHLERDSSVLHPHLIDGESFIYAQGSIATSTTIISGTDEDRFDLDAVVEIDVPQEWSDSDALDKLEEALQGFPGVIKIIRCTRCIQLQFPFMHMDVTILDRSEKIAVERAGAIFHSPDDGNAYRVQSNPWGFTDWYRASVSANQAEQFNFQKLLTERRQDHSYTRLTVLDEQERMVLADAQQEDLPAVIPSELDAQQSVALKLLKRYLNLTYADLDIKRPPSIYLTKRTGDYGYHPSGITAQLFGLADFITSDLKQHIANGTRPCEVNPSYAADVINDRWPRDGSEGMTDLRTLTDALETLKQKLEELAQAPLSEMSEIVDFLFGERIGAEQRKILKDRYQRTKSDTGLVIGQGSGQIFAPAIVRSNQKVQDIPSHNFHCGTLKRQE